MWLLHIISLELEAASQEMFMKVGRVFCAAAGHFFLWGLRSGKMHCGGGAGSRVLSSSPSPALHQLCDLSH